MGSRHLFFILAAGAVLQGAEGPVDSQIPKAKADASATVTVTAEAAPVEIKKTPNPVRIIDAEAIQRSGARNLAELLQQELPGQVSQSGSPGTVASPQLNGMRSQDTVVLLDGVRLVNATGTGTDLSEVQLAGVARVEIQRGPASVLYGSDAQGGVIALYTDVTGAKGNHGDLALGLGTNGLARLNGSDALGWGSGTARLALSGGRQDAPTEADNRFREGSAFLGLTQNLGENHSLSLIYRDAFQGTPIPYKSVSLGSGPRPASSYASSRQDTIRSQQAIGTLRSGWGADLTSELTLGYAELGRMEPNDFGVGYFAFNSYASQANLTLHWTPSSAWSGSVLLQGLKEQAVLPDYVGGIQRGEGHHLAMAAELAWEPLDTLRLVGGLRHQHDRQDYLFTNNPGVPDTRDDQTTGKLGVNWLLPAGFRVYASGGSAFSNPLLYQVMYNATNGGAELTNEKSHFLQAGFGWTRGPWNARVETWRTKLGTAVLFDDTTFLYYMGRDLRFQGVEGALGYRSQAWGVEGWIRSQEARDLTLAKDQQLQGENVVRRPFLAFGLTGDATWGSLRGDLRWSWQGPHYDTFGSYPPLVGPSRTHFNDLGASLAWAFPHNMSLALRGEHLLQPKISKADWLARRTDFENDAYQVYNFPAAPPTVSLEFRVKF